MITIATPNHPIFYPCVAFYILVTSRLRDSKLGREVDASRSYPTETKHPDRDVARVT